MGKITEDLRIRLVTSEDKQLMHNFFRELGGEGSTFFNRYGGNEKGANDFLDGNAPERIYWAAVTDTENGGASM